MRSLESGFHMIAAIAELFFFLAKGSDHMEIRRLRQGIKLEEAS